MQELKKISNHQGGYDHFFKIALIGEDGVGRTNLLFRFTDQGFTKNPVLRSPPFCWSTVQVDNKIVKLQILDTEIGRDEFYGIQGAFLVYDITDKDSFEKIKDYVAQYKMGG